MTDSRQDEIDALRERGNHDAEMIEALLLVAKRMLSVLGRINPHAELYKDTAWAIAKAETPFIQQQEAA